MDTIVIELINDIMHKKLEVSRPISMIKYLVTVVEKIPDISGKNKKEMVIEIAKTICSGKDGVLGTEDDIFPSSLVNGLEALIKSGVLDDIIDLAHKAVIPYNYPILYLIFGRFYNFLKISTNK